MSKELKIECRKTKADIALLSAIGDCVEKVSDFYIVEVQIEEGLTLGINASERPEKT